MSAPTERGVPQRSAAQGRGLSPIDNFGIGYMKSKTSKESKTYGVRNGMPLNYQFDYEYYDGTHQAEKIGDMHYRYDLNGNVTVERSGGHGTVTGTVEGYWREGDLYGADYGFALARPGSHGGRDAYERRYEWDRRNRLIRTKDPQWTVDYRYGYDGQRRLKYAQENRNETAYFNNMWQTSASANSRDWLQSKHIFVGESRIATKSNREVWESGTDNNLGFEINNQYWYHGDHLGSAQVVTERGGSLLERIEYTPYGEIWVEHKYDAAESSLPYRFTGKELDPETNFYYFGARYLDPRTSRWLSTDPAMGDYIPSAPINDEAKKRNGSLPGMGGVFNTVNLHVYHYAGNNPVKYVDPDGRSDDIPTLIRRSRLIYAQDLTRDSHMYRQGGGGNYPLSNMTQFGTDGTYCNLSTFDIADAVGFNQQALYGSGNRGDTTANSAGKNLADEASKGTIQEVTPERAQELADSGMVVIASWINPNGSNGHMSTVRPSSGNYDPDVGPMVSNVGGVGNNQVLGAKRAFAGNEPKYYYDPNQSAKYDYSKMIKILE